MLSISLWSGSSFKTLGYPGLVFQNFFSPYTPRLKPRPPHNGAASEEGEHCSHHFSRSVRPLLGRFLASDHLVRVSRNKKQIRFQKKHMRSQLCCPIISTLYLFFFTVPGHTVLDEPPAPRRALVSQKSNVLESGEQRHFGRVRVWCGVLPAPAVLQQAGSMVFAVSGNVHDHATHRRLLLGPQG
jgi:hypothetical protein